MEAVWFESGRLGLTGMLPIVSRFGFRWRDMPDRPQQSLVVVPVHPVQRGQFYLLAAAPRLPMDHLGLVQPVDRLGQRAAIAIVHAARRQFDPGLG